MAQVDLDKRLSKQGTNLLAVNSKVGKLKESLAKQANDLNTAQEARAVIRNDVLSMMSTMKAQNDRLANQLKENFESIEATEVSLKTNLDEQRMEYQSLKNKLELRNKEMREHLETKLYEVETKLFAATSSVCEIQNAVHRFEECLRSTEAQQTKDGAETRGQLEKGLRDLESKLQAQDEELAQQLKEQIVGLDTADSILTTAMEKQSSEHQLLKRKLELYNKELRGQYETGMQHLNSKLNVATTTLRKLEDALKTLASEQGTVEKELGIANSQLKDVRDQHEAEEARDLESRLDVSTSTVKLLEDTCETQSRRQESSTKTLEQMSSDVEDRMNQVERYTKSKQLKDGSDQQADEPEMLHAVTSKDKKKRPKNRSGLKKRREEIKELIASARSDVCFPITEGENESRDSSSAARE